MALRLNLLRQFLLGMLFVLLTSIAAPGIAQNFPPLAGRVVDNANFLPDAYEAELSAKLAAFEKQSGRQFVVATIADMQGYALDDYGYRLGRAWGIGDKNRNDGIILFLAPNERPGQRGPRIEVGYGLEPIITDAISSRITKGIMTPLLRNGDSTGAVTAGVDALIKQMNLSPDEAARQAKAAEQQVVQQKRSGGVDIGTVIFWLFIFFFFILPMIRGIFGGGRRGRRYRSSSGPVIIWGGGSGWGSGGGSSWGSGGGFGDGGGFSGGGGSFGGGGASGDW